MQPGNRIRMALAVCSCMPVLTRAEVELSLADLFDLDVTTASKKAEPIDEAPSNITVVTESQFKAWGSRDLKDVLRRVVGFPVIADRDEWVFGARGSISDNNQKYLILVDGHRMNSVENFGPGQIIELPNDLSMIKRVEVIRGPGSAVWGPDALAGVVNLITKNAEDMAFANNASVQVGEDGYQVGSFQVARKVGDDAQAVFMGTVAASDGRDVSQSASSGFAGYKTGPVPEKYNTRLENHRPSYNLMAKAKVGDLRIQAMAFQAETFNRHYAWDEGISNYLTTTKQFVEGAYTHAVNEQFRLEAKLAGDVNRAEYQPYDQDPTIRAGAQNVNIVWLDRRLLGEVGFQYDAGSLNLTGGADYTFTKVGPNQRIDKYDLYSKVADASAATSPTRGYWVDRQIDDQQVGGYAIANWKQSEFLSLVGGARADYNDQRGSDKFNVNPRAAVIVHPLEGTTFKALYNRGYLRPSNFQSAEVDSMKSETMDQFDLVWMQRMGSHQTTVTFFHQKLNGAISLLPGGSYNYNNVSDYTSKGVEFEYLGRVGNSDLVANGSYTIAEASNFNELLAYNSRRVDPEGNVLGYNPWSLGVGVVSRLFSDRLSLAPYVRAAGPATIRNQLVTTEAALKADSNYTTLDPAVYLDLGVTYAITPNISVQGYIDNLLDETSAAPQSIMNGSIGQYGRHASIKVTAGI